MICIDETELSEMALEPARKVADPSEDIEILLFHVIPPPGATGAEPYSGSKSDAEQAIKSDFERRAGSARKRLEALATQFDVPVTVEVVSDRDPAGAIIRRAETDGIDLVSLATHSREQMPGDRHVGQIAERVTLSGVAPVLLAHSPIVDAEVGKNALSPGVYVFTADGIELGPVKDVDADQFRVERADGTTIVLPHSAAAAVQGGKIALHWDAAMLERTGDTH
jgi:nucleotide-binding universal stress UspA family protein